MPFASRLRILGYLGSFDIEDAQSFRQLIFWLENDKIRYYPPESRDNLLPESNTWDECFKNYLNELGYTLALDNNKIIIDWLLMVALRYDIEDKRSQASLSRESLAALAEESAQPSDDSFSKFDVNSPQFVKELGTLCKDLNIPFNQEEPLVVLRAVSLLLNKTKNSDHSKSSSSSHVDSVKKSKVSTQLDDNIVNQPFSAKTTHYSRNLNRAANVLRLLYINDLRHLQTQINSMMVEVQSLTANPKTDTALGKVGY